MSGRHPPKCRGTRQIAAIPVKLCRWRAKMPAGHAHIGPESPFRRRSPPKLAISPLFLVIIADLWNATALDLSLDGSNSAAKWPELESSRHPRAADLRLGQPARHRGQARGTGPRPRPFIGRLPEQCRA